MTKLKRLLSQGKKVASKDMIINGDYLQLQGSTVIRSWGGNEQFIGDRYFSYGKIKWYEVK